MKTTTKIFLSLYILIIMLNQAKGQGVMPELNKFKIYTESMHLNETISSLIWREASTSEYNLLLIPLLFSDSAIVGKINFDKLRYRLDTAPSAQLIKKINFVAFTSDKYYSGAYIYSFEGDYLDWVINKYYFNTSQKSRVFFPFSYCELVTILNRNGILFFIQNSPGVYYVFGNDERIVYRKTTLNEKAEAIQY